MNLIKKIIFICIFVFCGCLPTFAAKWTITNGLDFNARVKMAINKEYTSATYDKTIKEFKYSDVLPEDRSKLFDISEDGDSSVLAYIENDVIYYVAEEDVYLNQDASYMFDKFINLQSVDLSYLNFSKTKKMNFIFGNCKFLTNVNMDNDTTINLNEMKGMFYDCQSLVELNLYMLNTKNVNDMSFLFYNCKNLKNIYITPDIWKITKVKNFNQMFSNCYMLKTNFGKKAIDIDSSTYNKYAIAGNDDKEGLLKDVDYEYDDYGDKDGKYTVDKINDTVLVSNENKNTNSDLNADFLKKSKTLSKVNISTDSVYYVETISDDKNALTNDSLKTMGDVPILIDETTYVDKLVRKKKPGEATNSTVAPEENNDNKIVGGMLRPKYDDINIASYSEYYNNNNNDKNIQYDEIKESSISNLNNDNNIENNNIKNNTIDNKQDDGMINVNFNIPSSIVIILGIIVFISLGIVLNIFKK